MSKINLWRWIDGKVKFVFLCKVKAEPLLDVPDNYLNDNFNDNLDDDGNGKAEPFLKQRGESRASASSKTVILRLP